MQQRVLLAGVAAPALFASAAPATIVDISQPNVRLSQVLGHSFIVGDKKFTIAADGFSGNGYSASHIKISPLIDSPDPNTGRGFRLTGLWGDGDLWLVAPDGGGEEGGGGFTGGANHWVLSYSVEILPEFVAQGYRFSDASLGFDGHAFGHDAEARVDETLRDANGGLVGDLSVFANSNGTADRSDHLLFGGGLTRLNVVKDVQFEVGDGDDLFGGGVAWATQVDQKFSQVILIPLPGAVWMGMVGLAGAAVFRRR